MCKMASFLWKRDEEDKRLQIAVYDLMSHSNTQEHLGLTEKAGWFEGHYTPKGEIECRTPNGKNKIAEKELKIRYNTFKTFLQWCLEREIGGSLDLMGCDLKGIKLPDSIGGNLDLRDCDLKGIKIPARFKVVS